MGSKPQAPTYPDPKETAQTQTESNIKTATAQTGLNAINQVTPQGSLTYSQIGKWEDGTPRFQATTSLSPEQQALFNQQQQMAGKLGTIGLQQADKIGGILGTNVDLSSGNINRYVDDHFADDFNRDWDRNQTSLDSQLANKGLKVGSTAYSRAMQDFNTSRANARDNLYGNMYDRALGSMLTERSTPINEITALLSGSQVQGPQFASTPQSGIESTDVAGLTNAQYNSQYNNYQNQVAQNNAMWGGLSSLGSSLIGGWAMSDRDAKTDVKRVGKLPNDLNVYEFKYKKGLGGGGLAQMGLMAQDVEKKVPGAVATGPDGYKRVNYPRAMRA